jgi:hypothetical protein
MRGSAACAADAPFASVAKFQRSEALVPGLCFAHGSNINSRDESCGKLKASGFCAKSLAAKSGQSEARAHRRILGANLPTFNQNGLRCMIFQ